VTDNCSGATFACAPPSGSVFPVGTTTVTCTATDVGGATAECTFTVTVNDVEPPVITDVSASPDLLWPPNHKMVDVTITAVATDNCDASPTCAVTAVASDEPVTGHGSGNTSPDWIILGGQIVQLRAERMGSGDGRVYSVTDTCTDDSGNTSSAVAEVTVPHDMGR
jgi:hypothetical protein